MSGSRWVMRLWESWRWVRLVRLARLRGRLSRKLSERSSKERLEEAGVDQRTAERLLAFFRQRFDPGLTELAPL